MEGGMNLNQPLVETNSPLSSGVSEILKTAFRISGKSKAFMISVALIVLLPYCLLVLGADLTFVRFTKDIVTSMELLSKQDLNSLEAKEIVEGTLKDVWLLLGFEVFFLAFFFIVSMFSLVTMVYAYAKPELSIKELFTKTRRSWMRQVISWFYRTFMLVGIVALVLLSIDVVSLRIIGVAAVVVSIMFTMMGTLCYLYFAAVWMFSMVVSVVEVDINEPMPVEKSEEHIKGKRIQGFVLMLVMSVIAIVVFVAFICTRTTDRQEIGIQSRNGVMMLCYVCLLKIFMFVLYSINCYECKRRKEENGDAEGIREHSRVFRGV